MLLRYSVINKGFQVNHNKMYIFHKHKGFPFYFHIFNDTEQVIYNSYVCIKSLHIIIVIFKIRVK